MSDSNFDFRHKPFSSVPDPECYVPLEFHEQAWEGLQSWMKGEEGCALLTGAAGLGKTLLCLRLKRQFGEKFRIVLLSHGNFPNVLSFLKSLLYQLESNYSGLDEQELRLELERVLAEKSKAGEKILLMIDGAHELGEEILNEVQILSGLEESGAPGVMILLSGQLELEELLARRSLSALNQRIQTHEILEALTKAESADYLAGRLEWAGCDIEEVFDEDAVDVMLHVSDGVPRCLNRIAETALRIARKKHLDRIDLECVREAYADVRHLPLQWNAWPDDGQLGMTETPRLESDTAVETPRDDVPLHEWSDQGKSAVPDLKSEAEAAGVEYVVAEFGGDEDEDDQPSTGVVESETLAETSGSMLDPGQNSLQNKESSVTGFPVELPQSLERDQDMKPSADSDQYRDDVPMSPYLRSRTNPIDIFAADIPAEPAAVAVAAPPMAVPIAQPVVHEMVTAQPLEAIAQQVEQVVNEEPEQTWEEELTDPSKQYDVIEPERIPEMNKMRPTLELDLPHREPQPRYRNLFRDLRRRRK